MKSKNSGFTLTEVLVAVVIGVLSIAAAFASYGYFNKSYKSVSQKAAINSAARDALTVIARDLRNAGYVDINFKRDPKPEIRLINLRQKYLNNLDRLGVWYTTSPNDRMRVNYTPMKYQNSNKTTSSLLTYTGGRIHPFPTRDFFRCPQRIFGWCILPIGVGRG